MEKTNIKTLVRNELNNYGYLCDFDTYELIYINNALSQMLKITDDGYKGKFCYEVIQGRSTPCEFCKKNQLSFDNYLTMYHFNEKYNIHLSVKSKKIDIEGKSAILRISIDITDEIRLEEELLKATELENDIIKSIKNLINDKDIDITVNVNNLMKAFCDFYGGTCAYIFYIDTVNNTRTCCYDYVAGNLPKLSETIINQSFPLTSQWAQNLINKPFFYTDDINEIFDENEISYKMLNDANVKSMLNVPFKRNGEIAGFIGVDNPSKYDNNYEIIATTAMILLNVIDNNNSLKQWQFDKDSNIDEFEVGETLIKCANSLLDDSQDAITSIHSLLKVICSHYDCECAYSFEWDRENKIVSNTYEYVYKENSCINDLYYIEHRLIDNWFEIFEKNGFYFIESIKDLDPEHDDYKLFIDTHIYNILMVPLIRDNKIIGATGMDNIEKNYEDIELLHTISGFIANYIQQRDLIKELEVLSYTDTLTGLYNRNYYQTTIEGLKLNPPQRLGIIFADVNGLKKANDKLGHEYGDILLKWSAIFLKNNLKNSIYRIGGDEFVCFIEGISEYDFDYLIQEMRDTLKKMAYINISIGSTWNENNIDVDKQFIETDQNMYLEKQKYYELMSEQNLSKEEELTKLKEAILELKKSL